MSRLLAALAALVVWGPDREWILGDLEEGYARRRAKGRPALGWWVTRTLASALHGVSSSGSRGQGIGKGEGMAGFVDGLRGLVRTFRGLRRAPVFTVTTVLTLGLGIGSATGIYNLVDAVVLQPLSIDPDGRLVRLWDQGNVDAETLARFEQSPLFETVSGLASIGLTLAGDAPQRLSAVAVSPSHFAVLGAQAARGRVLGRTDLAPGAAPVVVISHGLWTRAFASDPDIVGRTVSLRYGEITQRTVVGVLAPDHDDVGYVDPDAWIPLTPEFAATAPEAFDLFATGRLSDGTTVDEASGHVRAIAGEQQRLYPDRNHPDAVERARAIPLHAHLVQEGTRTQLILLLVGGCMVFLISCGNAINLLLARTSRRARELAVRASLGGGRGAVVRLLVTEAALLGVLGGGVAVLGIAMSEAVLVSYLGQIGLPRVEDIAVGPRVWLFSVSLSVVAAAAIGWVPALRMTRSGRDLSGLTSGARGGGMGRDHARVSRALVSVQVAFAVPVVAAALLLARSSMHLGAVDVGFEVADRFSIQTIADVAPGAEADDVIRSHAALLDAYGQLSGVETVAATTCLPMARCSWWSAFWAGDEDPEVVSRDIGFVRPISAGYLGLQGIDILAGREITAQDSRDTEPVAVISESMATTLFPQGDALGRTIRLSRSGRSLSVVGIVADVLHRGPDGDLRPTAYTPLSQFSAAGDRLGSMYYLFRYSGSTAELVDGIRRATRGVDPTIPVADLATMDAVVAARSVDRRAIQVFLWGFSGLALFLSFAGVLGVSSYVASQRRREVGIRLAVGAHPASVAMRTTSVGMAPVLLGVAGGIILALLATRGMETLLFGVRSSDPITYVGVVAVTLSFAAAATAAPAVRSATTDPSQVLWGE